MSLTIANDTDKDITISHSGQKYDFKLFDKAGDTVYTWSADKLCAMIEATTNRAGPEPRILRLWTRIPGRLLKKAPFHIRPLLPATQMILK